MARIVITHFAGIFYKGKWRSVCFFDGLFQELTAAGNDVLQVATSDFVPRPWNGNNVAFTPSMQKEVIQKIKDFSPDLIISFNNSSIEGLEDEVSCPIALWDADTFEFFSAKETIRKKIDRYHFFAFSPSSIKNYQNNLNISADKICRIPICTAVRNEPMEKKYNISFIGNPFFPPDSFAQMLRIDGKRFKEIVRDKDNADKHADFLKDYHLKPSNIKHISAGDIRLLTVANLAPLGIDLFGPLGWRRILDFSIDAALGYHPKNVYSLKHNSDIYNSSKISLSIAHSQNSTGYPWRVPDIMGSGAVLLSDFRQDIIDDFSKYVKLPMFENPAEAYFLAKKLLADPQWREDLVLGSNAAIDAERRWVHAFKIIEDFIGVKLVNPEKQGSFERLEVEMNAFEGQIDKYLSVVFRGIFNFKNKIQRPRLHDKVSLSKRIIHTVLPDFIRGIAVRASMDVSSSQMEEE